MEISDVTIYLTEGRDEYKSRPALCGHLFVAGVRVHDEQACTLRFK